MWRRAPPPVPCVPWKLFWKSSVSARVARLHVGQELTTPLGHVDDRRVGVVLPAHARRGARGPARGARLLEHDGSQSALREKEPHGAHQIPEEFSENSPPVPLAGGGDE